jgi:hypothetical protein
MPIGNSILVFTQNFGGILFLSLAELIFKHTLSMSMAIYAPNINTQNILDWGATGFRDHVSKDEFPEVLKAYNKAVTTTLYLAVGGVAVACMSSCGMGWKSVKKPKTMEPEVECLRERGIQVNVRKTEIEVSKV